MSTVAQKMLDHYLYQLSIAIRDRNTAAMPITGKRLMTWVKLEAEGWRGRGDEQCESVNEDKRCVLVKGHRCKCSPTV